MKRIVTAAAWLLLASGTVALALALWGRSDPARCVAEVDPAVALANERAGEGEPYRDWCHEFEGDRLHVVEAGEGEVVLFIHGFPTIWYSMIRPMEHMRGRYRVVAIDGLGAGLSDAPREEDRYNLEAMSRHLDALIADLSEEKVHIVGHDWGAAFAGAYAQSRPARVSTLTIMSAPPQNIVVRMLETSEKQRQISRYVEQLKGSSPVLALLTGARGRIAKGPQNHFEARRMSAEEARVLQDATSDMRRINRHINWYRANLPSPDRIAEDDFFPGRDTRLEVPTLLIWGEDDTIFDPAFIDLLMQSSSNLEVLRLEGVGHAPQFEATEAVNEALSRFLDGSSEDLAGRKDRVQIISD